MANDDIHDLILIVNRYKSIPLYLKHYTPESVHAYGQGVVKTSELDRYRIFVHVRWNKTSMSTQLLKRLPWETMWHNHKDNTPCIATTTRGPRCKNPVMPNPYEHQKFNVFCKTHLDQRAKEQHQKGYPMREVYGEFWDYPTQIKVITTNGFVKSNGSGVMGAGVAKQAKERYPGIEERLGAMLQKHGNRPVFLDREDGIVSMPVKHHWKEMADLDLIRESAIKLVEMADKWEWESILVPRPGCGNGGLNWQDVRPVLEEIWDDRFLVITWGQDNQDPKVYNRRHGDAPADAVYVGRPSKWGNIYSHLSGTQAEFKVDTREESIEAFESYVHDSGLINDIDELKGQDLVCWCASEGGVTVHDDLVCHGQVLLRLANKEPEMFTYTYEGVTYITITGHRPSKLGGYNPKAELNIKVFNALEAKMINAVSKFDNVVFRIGMAIGVDQMAAWICVKHGFTFDAYVPCEGHESRWPKHVQDEYRKLLTFARDVYTTHEGPYPGAWVMQERNKQMVDGSDYVLSVYDGSPGGTQNCFMYAREKGVKVVNINPKDL